jgi:hypothetical protein
MKSKFALICLSLAACMAQVPAAQPQVGRFGVFERQHRASGAPANPYTAISAEATFLRPDGSRWTLPLFWDGGTSWRVRISPDAIGKWSYTVRSADAGLNGAKGSFECVASDHAGGLTPMRDSPSHFQRQNGKRVWFLGDTAWGYFIDSEPDNHHRPQAEHYVKSRAGQGFNVIHSMLLSEVGGGNQNGAPFDDLASEKLNPRYWQEVDSRLAFANAQGLTVGLAIAWADKQRTEPFAWRRFPGIEARKRYARYVAARYSAYDVYFLVAGEWNAEIRTREKTTAGEVFAEYVRLGDALASADPHERMIGIHPGTRPGSVREFASTPWMSFGDYQQNYRDLHRRVLLSRYLRGPVVNSEYGYLLRDNDGDGQADKANSYSTADMRHASWDIVMAGGYLVTGFGTTYLAGHRDPGPFDVEAAKNDEWERQIGHFRALFEQVPWWKLIPADALVSSAQPRQDDRIDGGGREVHPPAATYWAIADPGGTYLIYARGMTKPIMLDTACWRQLRVRLFNPRTGEFTGAGSHDGGTPYTFQPPDGQDWVALLDAAGEEKNR